MKIFFLCIFCFLFVSIYSQNNEVDYKNNYIPLKSLGEIPKDFKKLAEEKSYEDFNSLEIVNNTLTKKEKKFIALSNYEINQTLFSGRVLFGDKTTQYLNQILDEILKNDLPLRNKIRIYTFKSSSVNAACTSDGIIFINIGLLAYVKNEAELAFIISHEISHFVKGHSLNSFIENEEILKSKESFDKKINKLFSQSKEKELEADSLGVLLFLKSNYNISEASNALNLLYYSYLPYLEISFKKDFFNGEDFNIPFSLFLDTLSSISPIGNIEDRYLSHPNVIKRKEQLSKILEDKGIGGDKDFIISKNTFEEVQELSRFENIRLSILQKNYGDVIYFSYELLQKYPNNIYLKNAVCKALYGLAKYKNLDKYQEVAKSYHRTEGEIQQIHFLLRSLNSVQINVLAIKYMQKTLIQNPENLFLRKLIDNLIEDLVLLYKVNVTNFFNTSFDNNIVADKNLFHKNAFVNDIKNTDFVNSFERYYIKLDSIKKWDNKSYKEKLKLQEIEAKNIEKYGLPFEVNKVIVLDPFYEIYDKDNGNYVKAERKKNEFENHIITISKVLGLDVELINTMKLSAENLSSYNNLSMLKEWMNERESHYDKNIISLLSDQVENIIQNYQTKYLYYSGIYELSQNTWYFMVLFDLQSGKIKYNNFQQSKNISKEEAYMIIRKDINFIKKH